MAECPRRSVSGKFENDFGHDSAGAAAGLKWVTETTKWIHDEFDDWCKNLDSECSKTLVLVKSSSSIDPVTKRNQITIFFEVICDAN